MPDISAIAGAMSSLKAMKDVVEALVGMRDATAFRQKQLEFQALIIDAQERIISAQEERTELVERVRALEKQIADIEAWDAEKEGYELKAVDRGAFVYVPRSGRESEEPRHWLCAACYQNRKKSILQTTGAGPDGRTRTWLCHACRAPVVVHWNVSPSIYEAEAAPTT